MKTKIKADIKLTVVMCCQIVPKRSKARMFPAAASAAAALLTEPQTATGVVYFIEIRPVYVFLKQKLKMKKKSYFLVSFTTTFFSQFSRPIFVRKIRLKSLNQIYWYLQTADR